jgi:hypothetical protein
LFGYIAPVLSVLSEEEKARYRAFYCGVCHALKTRFGWLDRISLSNDMTFLAMLLSSLYEPDTTETPSRCAVHPLKAHAYFSSAMIDYAADMNALLFYYKCEDQRMDDGSLRGKAGEKAFRKALREVSQRYPAQADAVGQALRELWAEEKAAVPNPDRLCNLSGDMLGAVFVPKPEDPWSGVLHAVGVGLGRFIYWMDAWEDYDEDRKKGRFNPLSVWHDRPDYEDFCRETLEMLIAEAAESFEILPLEQDLDLLRNVIYSGVWQRYHLKQERKQRKEDARAE